MNYRGELLWINGALWWMTNLVRVRCITGGLCAYGGQQWIMACIMVDIGSESGALWVRLWSTMVNCVAFRCILWYSIYIQIWLGNLLPTDKQLYRPTIQPTNCFPSGLCVLHYWIICEAHFLLHWIYVKIYLFLICCVITGLPWSAAHSFLITHTCIDLLTFYFLNLYYL